MSSSILSTMSIIVEQCCEDLASFNETHAQITMFVKQTQNKDIRIIVDSIKKIIKNKKTDSPSKFYALKLLHECLMMGYNEEFLKYVEKKIMSRLQIFARYRKESTDLDRGALLFGKNFNNQASADFLKMLLVYIQKWGTQFESYQNKTKSEMNKIYLALLKEHVTFPLEEIALTSLAPFYKAQQIVDTDGNARSSPRVGGGNRQSLPNFNASQFISHQQPSNSFLDDSRLSSRSVAKSNYGIDSSVSQSMSSSLSSNILQQQQQQPEIAKMTKQQQMEIAKKMKEDYKMLIECHGNAKFVEEVFQGSKSNGQDLDSELLVSFRTQLTEGKDFAEKYLKSIMDTPLMIKDKESKIDKILGIIAEISDQLEKTLVLMPYSPRALKTMKQKQQEEEIKTQKQAQVVPKEEKKVLVKPQGSPVMSNPQEQRSFPKVSDFNNQQNKNRFNTDMPLSEPIGEKIVKDPFWSGSNNQNDMVKGFDFSFPTNGNNSTQEVTQKQNFTAAIQENKKSSTNLVGTDRINLKASTPSTGLYQQQEVLTNPNDISPDEKPSIRMPFDLQPISNQKLLKQASNLSETLQVSRPQSRQVSELSDNKFGVFTQAQQSGKPQIHAQSPDSNVSSDEGEEAEVKMPIQKADCQFQQPNNMQQIKPATNQFAWDFDTNKQQQPQKQEFSFHTNVAKQPQKQQVIEPAPEFQFGTNFIKSLPHSNEQKFDFSSTDNNNPAHVCNEEALMSVQLYNAELTENVKNLKDQLANVHAHNNSILSQLKSGQDKQAQFEGKISILEQHKIVMKSNIDELNQQIKLLSKFQDLYQEEKINTNLLKIENVKITDQLDEALRIADELQIQFSKKEQQLQQVVLEKNNQQELRLQLEDDLEDYKKSESGVKQQLQDELFESKRSDDLIKHKLRLEISQLQKVNESEKALTISNQEEHYKANRLLRNKNEALELQMKRQEETSNTIVQQLKDQIKRMKDEEHVKPKFTLKQTQVKLSKEIVYKEDAQKAEVEIKAVAFDYKLNNISEQKQQPFKEEEIKQAYISSDESPMVTINDTIDVEEMFGNIPSSDSDKELPDSVQIQKQLMLDKIKLKEEKRLMIEAKLHELQVQKPVLAFDFSALPEDNQEEILNPKDQCQKAGTEVPQKKVTLFSSELKNIMIEHNNEKSDFTYEYHTQKTAEKIKIEGNINVSEAIKVNNFNSPLKAPLEEIKQGQVKDDFWGLFEDIKPMQEQKLQVEAIILKPVELIVDKIEQPPEKAPEVEVHPVLVNIVRNEDTLKLYPTISQQQSILIPIKQTINSIKLDTINVTPSINIQSNTSIQPQLELQSMINKPDIQDTSFQQQQQKQQQHQQDITYNKSQFTTTNTEVYRQEQLVIQAKLDPQAMLRGILLGFFRKSLASNKSVLYEDHHIQMGMIAEYDQTQAKMRIFIGNKNKEHPINGISLVLTQKPIGFELQMSKDVIPLLGCGAQDVVEITVRINSFQMNIPILAMSYKLNNVPVSNLPIRLPVVLLKFCNSLQGLDSISYLHKWNNECNQNSEFKQSFNIDFTQCKSLSSLKEVLMFGKNVFTFVDGVEAQKNIICGGTTFQLANVFALVKIMITSNGVDCEVTGRSNDKGQEAGLFSKFVISNILEMIALKIN